jgi:molybdenum cofactor synthesis domain-containing protein
MSYKAAIITVSDKGSKGERKDLSGPAIKEMLEKAFQVTATVIVPDEMAAIAETIRRLVDVKKNDLVITTGGTGVGTRDVTPEATRTVIDKELPGFAEVMRGESYKITPYAVISRAICGIRGQSLIINLPGSPKAATECLSFVLGAIEHALSKIQGDSADCARE